MSRRRTYLDHAGATVASPEQMKAVADAFVHSIQQPFANPHSSHPTGQITANMIDATRHRILRYFNTSADEYLVIFTKNATASLKLLAEAFDFGHPPHSIDFPLIRNLDFMDPDIFTGKKSTLLMLQDSHTSVVGMRQTVRCEQVVILRDFDQLCAALDDAISNGHANNFVRNEKMTNLLVLTAMSNFCGRKYDLPIDKLRDAFGNRWLICMDAAALVGCSPLDLDVQRPDFVAFSFYKMFGFPTGIGALLIRNKAASHLTARRYFGGGTVDFASPFNDVVRQRGNISQRLEDGTPDFYSISALRYGFDDLEHFGGIHVIAQNSVGLAAIAYTFLCETTHANGAPIAKVYGKGWSPQKVGTNNTENMNAFKFSDGLIGRQGAILSFNLLRDDGTYVGFVEVEKMADLFGIELRTGCFCNQGACALHLGLDEASMMRTFKLGKVCGDEMDLTEDGRPVGAVRISFGRTSTVQDVETFKEMVTTCFVTTKLPATLPDSRVFAGPAQIARLTHIFVYPVKSCSPIEPQSWPLDAASGGGLRYDRAWMFVSSRNGSSLTQKRFPALCTIQPEIDEQGRLLVLKDKVNDMPSLKIDLTVDRGPSFTTSHGEVFGKVCADSIGSLHDYGGHAATVWLTRLDASLGEDSRLVGLPPAGTRDISYEGTARRNFANQSDFLLVTRPSLECLSATCGLDYASVLRRFRPNFVIDFYGPGADAVAPFEEDHFEELYIGSARFKVVGRCTRCQMICVDQHTGQKDPNMLVALRDMRRPVAVSDAVSEGSLGDGKLTFGVYLTRVTGGDGAASTNTPDDRVDSTWGRVSVGCNVRIIHRRN